MKKTSIALATLALGGVFALASCGGLDDKDKIVDLTINQYVTKFLIDDIKDDTVDQVNSEYSNFTNFWTYLVVTELKQNKYDIDIKTTNSALYNYIKEYDVSTLSGADFGKYYYYAKAFDIDLSAYKTKYLDYVASDTGLASEYYEYGEYSIPFEIAPAKNFNASSDKLNALINTKYQASSDFGYDGANWMYLSNTLLGKSVDYQYLDTLAKASHDNPTSIALSIASFAASNVNVRDGKYKFENKTLIDKLLESYDPELGLIKYDSADTGINYSTNQIYASLIAYKYQRDNKTAVNIFR